MHTLSLQSFLLIHISKFGLLNKLIGESALLVQITKELTVIPLMPFRLNISFIAFQDCCLLWSKTRTPAGF